MADAVNLGCPTLEGFTLTLGSSVISTADNSLNAANNRLAFSFVAQESKQISKILIYMLTGGGTLGSGDTRCDIHDDSAGSPGTSLSNSTTLSNNNPGVSGEWVEVSGFTQDTTRGARYWFVFRNMDGSPATNYAAIRYITNADFGSSNSAGCWNFNVKTSTNGGSSWSNVGGAVGSFRIEFSDGTFAGFPIQGTNTSETTIGVYSDREAGVKFTTPNDGIIRNLSDVQLYLSKTGTPTGDAKIKIYENATHKATSEVIPNANAILASGFVMFRFPDTYPLKPNTTYRAVLAESTQSDTSSNRFNINKAITHDSAASKALMPFGGWVQTYWDGSSWTDTDVRAPIFILRYMPSQDAFDPARATQLINGGLAA